MQPPGNFGSTASLMPMLILYTIIGLAVGFIATLINKRLKAKVSISGGIIGSYVGGIIGFQTGTPLFMLLSPVIGAVAVLYFVGLQKDS